jgi:RNA polymerase sigma-70 factor, ECF subfamily
LSPKEDESYVASRYADLERLYCAYRQQLFTCAIAITRSAAGAEEAVHDAFCNVLRQDQQPDDLKAYVFRAVRNAALDQGRRSAGRDLPLPDFIFDLQVQPAQSAEDAEFRQCVAESLLKLSADERETVVQHLYGELTFQEIASIRDAPLGTVVSWYRRGLDKLRTQLEITYGSV